MEHTHDHAHAGEQFPTATEGLPQAVATQVIELAAAFEVNFAALGVDEPRLELDAVALGHLAGARADQRVALAELAAKTRVDRLVQDAHLGQPPEEVAAEQALGQRLLPGTH